MTAAAGKGVSSVRSQRETPPERAARFYACALVTVHALFLPYGGYERMMEGKYVCFLLLSLGWLAALGLSRPLRPPFRQRLLRVTPLRLCAAAYLLFSMISALLSPYGAQTLLGGPRRDGLLTLALYALCGLALSGTLRADSLLPVCTAVFALLCDALALAQLAGFNPLGLYPAGLGYWDGDIAYPGFYAGTAGNIDFTAFLLALSVAVLSAAALRERRDGRPVRRLLYVPAVFLTLWTLLRLGVASAWAGLAFAAMWSPALLVPSRRRAMLLLSCALTAAALVLLSLYSGNNRTLTQAALALRGAWDGSYGSGRAAIWRDCLPLVREYPVFGGGPDTLHLRGVEPFTWTLDGVPVPADITAAHNEYLNILVNQGALALLAYLGLLGGALLRCFRRAGEPRMAVCGAALLCYAAMAFFSISTCITAPYVWLLLAVVLSDEIDG